MTAMTFDKLAYLDRLKAAGFQEPQARAMTDGLDQALREEVATKTDMAGLKTELKSDIAELKSEMAGLKAELKSDIADLRAELKGDIAGLRSEVKGEIGGLRAEMKADKVEYLKWAMMLVVGQTAVLLTAVKFLGH